MPVGALPEGASGGVAAAGAGAADEGWPAEGPAAPDVRLLAAATPPSTGKSSGLGAACNVQQCREHSVLPATCRRRDCFCKASYNVQLAPELLIAPELQAINSEQVLV